MRGLLIKSLGWCGVGAAVMLFFAAAAIPAKAQVGCDVIVYWDANFRGETWRTQRDQPYVGDHWNDQISSIRVLSGYWEFFWDINYGGERLRLGRGDYAFVGNHWNDQISSFRCLHS